MSDSIDNPSGIVPVRAGQNGRRAPHPSRHRIPVVFKLTLLVGLTLAFLLAVIVAANGLFWGKLIPESVDKQLSGVAASRRDMVRAQVELLRQRVELNTDRGEVRGFFYELANGMPTRENRAGSEESLRRIASGKPIVAAALADKTGLIVLSTNPAEVGRSVAAEPEFQAGRSGTFIGRPRENQHRYEATLAAPMRTRSEPPQLYGVLLATADLSDLASALRDSTGLGKTGEAILGARDGGQLHFLFPPRNAPQTVTVPVDAVPALKAATEGAEILVKSKDYRGVDAIAVGRPIGYEGWGLVVKMDQKEAYQPIAVIVLLEALAGLFATGIGLIAAYFLARSFTRPIRDLAQAAARITAGDYGTAVPVKSGDEFGALSASFNEMTAAIQVRRGERERAEESLREADRRKDEFLAMLGHELRNPLSAIANAVRLWRVAESDRNTTELARDVIERQTANLSRLVDDLLDVSRITEGKIELREEPVDLVEMINRAVEAARPFIDDRRHELEISLTSEARLYVEADPTRLEQIISNLLNNAIKYTRRSGLIRIETRRDGGDAVVSVSDSGIGISPRLLPHVFDLFAQGDRSLDRTTGGLGIGLHLCRRLVALHGGTITAASEGVGRGSTFTVRLPATTAPEPALLPAAPEPPASSSRRRRILLVDDNQDTVHSLARLLRLRGHEVATAFDGPSALQLAQEFQPEFLLLDLGLPGLDGYEVARRLRSTGFTTTPIVAISGYAQASDRARSREAGFSYHFAKPVDFDALAEMIVEDPIAAAE